MTPDFRPVPPRPGAPAPRTRRRLAALLWLAPWLLALVFLTPTSAQNQPATFGGLPYAARMNREQVAARIQAVHNRMPYVPGEALVKFRDGFESAQQQRALSALRGGGASGARWIADTLLVTSESEPDSQLMADILSRQPEVEWAQPNYIRHPLAVPNDPFFASQWNMRTINMPGAWDISHGGTSTVTIAIIDYGVTEVSAVFPFSVWNGRTFDALSVPFRQDPDISAGRFTGARDVAFWAGPVLDMVGHGTHVAGTALQETNNNLGFAGIAYNSRLMPVKVCVGPWELRFSQGAMRIPGFVDPDDGGCLVSDVIEGLRYAADSGAQVINMSLGGPSSSPAELAAIRYAVQKGAFVAMAGGNSFEEGNPVEYPAAYGPQIDGAMSVGAVGPSRRRAFYSSTGSYIEIAAPGGDSRDGGASGVIYQEGHNEADIDPTGTAPRFDRYDGEGAQGTSMASPHIAGVAALLYAQGIRTPAAIEAAIKRFAIDLGAPGRDDEYGYGLVDARATLRGLGVAK